MPRTVQLSDEAYTTLAALKRKGESFSDVVKRLARDRKDPLALRRLTPIPREFDVARARMADAERARLAARLGRPGEG